MKFLPLLLSSFTRHKVRTVLTVLSIVVAFLLFGYLSAIRLAFAFGAEIPGADRLIVRHHVTLMRIIPLAYERSIEQIEGVAAATHSSFFVGVYKEPRNLFPQFAVDPAEFLDMNPDFILPEDQKQAWMATRTGAIVGRGTAERFGFRIGDKIQLFTPVWEGRSGGNNWEFDLVGIYDGANKETDVSNFFFRYDYFDENRLSGKGRVSVFMVRVDRPENAAAVASRIDRMFENSPEPTKTESEAALLRGIAAQLGNIGAIVTAILTVVFFTMLLITANTMAESVRERLRELGVMKAIGFSDRLVLSLVLAESCLIAAVGGAIGIALAWIAVSAHHLLRGFLPSFILPAQAIATGAALIVALGIASGALPAIQAMRLDIAETLRTD
ncbi:MAG TPA: FtsX-like permease family protein [Thermoanaerobaculia bacterium]|nr:FtsX-like permease family protein [Thermoanaerobaculia bacterium]